MRQDITDQFNENLARIRRLVATYDAVVPPGAGRPSVAHTDILRAAVVLLHATMEDLLRRVTRLRLPSASPKSFEDIPFPASDKLKLGLNDLCTYRGKSIDEVFSLAIEQFLSKALYNNTGEVTKALLRADIPPAALIAAYGGKIAAITARRHRIVHHVDANTALGSGHHAARPLSPATVNLWIQDIEDFGKAVLLLC